MHAFPSGSRFHKGLTHTLQAFTPDHPGKEHEDGKADESDCRGNGSQIAGRGPGVCFFEERFEVRLLGHSQGVPVIKRGHGGEEQGMERGIQAVGAEFRVRSRKVRSERPTAWKRKAGNSMARGTRRSAIPKREPPGEELLSSLRRSCLDGFLRLLDGEAADESDQVRDVTVTEISYRRHAPLAFGDDFSDFLVREGLDLLRAVIRDGDTERLGHGGPAGCIRAVADRALAYEQRLSGRRISLTPGKLAGDKDQCEKNYNRYALHRKAQLAAHEPVRRHERRRS